MTSSHVPQPATARPGSPLKGEAAIPGDKSISHRAAILGALAIGETRISGLLEGEDVLATVRAVRQFGADIERTGPGEWAIRGFGTGGFGEPDDVIDCGNSGTGARLLIGAMATSPVTAVFTGDASLRSRPMERIAGPLSGFGARFVGPASGRLPMAVAGTGDPIPVAFEMSSPSAQVKSAILLAGLNAPGRTVVVESASTRDHTERMLRAFGAGLEIEDDGGSRRICLEGHADLRPQSVVVPGDPSSAAFALAAGVIVPDSDIVVRGVATNPTRTGFIRTLEEMGARIAFDNAREEGGESVADLRIRHCELAGVEVPPDRAPSMIDEYPILSAVAAFAKGDTVMHGVSELRIKESDRIDAMAAGLCACGVETEQSEDSLTVHGRGADGVSGGATCESRFDHRIAMSFLCLGLGSRKPVSIDDASAIATSFPGFRNMLADLGADIDDPERKPEPAIA